MSMAKRLALAISVVAAIGVGLALAHPDAQEITAEPLLTQELAGEPGKEVDAELYTFPPGASTPWHIHPDAHEITYVLQGRLKLEIEGEPAKELTTGTSFYLAPNLVHRGSNDGAEPAKLYVVRVKPVGKRLVEEVLR